MELKQWERCDQAEGKNEVTTFVGGAMREVLHPSAQANQYRMYLQDNHTAFYDGVDPVALSACSYLHNYRYESADAILDARFREVLGVCPLFSKDEVGKVKDFLLRRLRSGEGLEVLNRVEESTYRPSKKLMEHVGNVIKGRSEYVLLDEQLIVYDKIMAWAKQGFHDRQKAVIVVKGGPGTGKSVIAINLMADLLLNGYNAHYATGSRAFTETLRKVIGTRGSVQFKYFNSYMDTETNAVDVLFADEAHRLRKTSNSMYTPKADRRDTPQVDELIRAAKVSVFFIDDDQVVRPDEIGSVQHITDAAMRNGCGITVYQLEAQFRCAGSDGFVNWVNNTLGIRKTA
ncbi:MAG TPA: DNA/RNA helicase domain-containing protein, partial [Chloroflexota bacterium]|nr:DNA/RNA helicase domain-containing protein [Chloroflexota bacterium]